MSELVCRECGTEMEYDWMYCPECGWKLPDSWEIPEEEDGPRVLPFKAPPRRFISLSSRKWIQATAWVLLAALLAGVWMWFHRVIR